MAGLSYDYRWSPINTNFNDANSLIATGSQALGSVGDIFSKLADRIALRENQRAELALREAGLDIDRDKMGLERDRMKQNWDIAILNDAREREKLQREIDKDTAGERDKRLRAEAFNRAVEEHNRLMGTLPQELEKANTEYNSIGADYIRDRIALNDFQNREEEALKRIQSESPKEDPNSSVWIMGHEIKPVDVLMRSQTPSAETNEAERDYVSNQAARNILESIMGTEQYRRAEEADSQKAAEIDRRRQRLAVENAALHSRDWFPFSYAKHLAAVGADPASPLPVGVDIPFRAQYQGAGRSGSSGGSGVSGSSEGSGAHDEFIAGLDKMNTTIPALAKEAGWNWNDMSTDKQQRIIDTARLVQKEYGTNSKTALTIAFGMFDKGWIYDSMKEMPNLKGSF